MKIIIIMLLVLSFNSFGVDIIDLEMTVEMGMIPGGTFKTYDFTRRIYDKLSFYGDFNFEVQMFNDYLFYGVGAKIHMWKVRESKSFKPDSVNFLFFAGIRFGESVELFWRQRCFHPIYAWSNGNESTDIEGSFKEVGIKLTFNLFDED